jgi:hypothetical protein
VRIIFSNTCRSFNEFRHWKGNRLEINVTVWEYGEKNMRKRDAFFFWIWNIMMRGK